MLFTSLTASLCTVSRISIARGSDSCHQYAGLKCQPFSVVLGDSLKTHTTQVKKKMPGRDRKTCVWDCQVIYNMSEQSGFAFKCALYCRSECDLYPVYTKTDFWKLTGRQTWLLKTANNAAVPVPGHVGQCESTLWTRSRPRASMRTTFDWFDLCINNIILNSKYNSSQLLLDIQMYLQNLRVWPMATRWHQENSAAATRKYSEG